MKKILLMLAICVVGNVALAQVDTSAKEGARATEEKAKEVGDRAKAATSSQPDKSVYKAKAQAHKAKAHHHAHVAKEAGKEITK